MPIKKTLGRRAPVRRLSYDSTLPEIYGGGHGNPLFDCYSDEAVMALSFFGTYNPLLDWIGWEATDEYMLHKDFITYVGPQGTAEGEPVSLRLLDLCGPGNKVEWGKCDWKVEDFGTLRSSTPVRSIDRAKRRYNRRLEARRITGTPITNDVEWDMRLATSGVVGDLHNEIMDGDASLTDDDGVQISADGFKRLITYDYEDSKGNACTAMDSIVIDWAGKDIFATENDAEDDPITWNGVAVRDTEEGETFNLFQFIRLALEITTMRIANTPMLAGAMDTANWAMVLPTSWRSPILDLNTCWTLCAGDITRINSFEARDFRNSLNQGGAHGQGNFPVDGLDLGIMRYDHSMIDEEGNADILIMNRGPSTMPFIKGQYSDNTAAVAEDPNKFSTTDNNMLLTWMEWAHTCFVRSVQMQWRMLMPAPWAQIRITGVPRNNLSPTLSSDPKSMFFFGRPNMGQVIGGPEVEEGEPEEPGEPEG